MEIDDRKIIESFLDGDEEAFSWLVKKYARPVFNFVYQFVGNFQNAEDITQEAFVKAWKNIKIFNRKKSFKTWLYIIAKNTTYDYLKKKKTIPFSNFQDEEGNNRLENISDDSILPEDFESRKNFGKELQNKLGNLPEIYRSIIILHYKEDFSLRETSLILGEPYNTIKSRYRRALEKLKESFKENAPV